MSEDQETTLAFGAMALGATYQSGPPTPGSPLARAQALMSAGAEGLVTPEEVRDGVRRIQEQALADLGE